MGNQKDRAGVFGEAKMTINFAQLIKITLKIEHLLFNI